MAARAARAPWSLDGGRWRASRFTAAGLAAAEGLVAAEGLAAVAGLVAEA
jgi:hypothetical protein